MKVLFYLLALWSYDVAQANTVLTDDWVPLDYGECTGPGVAEGVWYPGDGTTCNFADSASYMPAEYQNGYVLAASQDLYNGFHTVDDFEIDCALNLQTADQTEDICGYTCGVCFMVSGPYGSAKFIVQEIADIGAVTDNGRGLNLHLASVGHDEIRGTNGGERNDIEYRRVPCTVTGGISFWFQSWGNGYNIYITPINYRIGITSIYARHGTGATDTNWYRMPREWTNQYWYKGWNSDDNCLWQPIHTPIWGDSTDGTFDLRLVSHLDEEVICYDMSLPTTPDSNQQQLACLDASGAAVQFSDPGLDTDSCRDDITITLSFQWDTTVYTALADIGTAVETELATLYGATNTDGWVVNASRFTFDSDASVIGIDEDTTDNFESADITITVVYDSDSAQSWNEDIANDIITQAGTDTSALVVGFEAIDLYLGSVSSDTTDDSTATVSTTLSPEETSAPETTAEYSGDNASLPVRPYTLTLLFGASLLIAVFL